MNDPTRELASRPLVWVECVDFIDTYNSATQYCFWTGRRKPGLMTTRRPCPNCGGRVELVVQ